MGLERLQRTMIMISTSSTDGGNSTTGRVGSQPGESIEDPSLHLKSRC